MEPLPDNLSAVDAPTLRKLWEDRSNDESISYPLTDYLLIAKRALRLGELLLACDVAIGGLRFYQENPELTRLAARALAEMGRSVAARKRVEPLLAAGHTDSETLGLLGRTFKDEGFTHLAAERSPDAAWAHSAAVYQQSFALHEDYFTGINAATMTFLQGDLGKSSALAAKVDNLAAIAIEGNPKDHWALATRGEVALLTQRWDDAETWYRKATTGISTRSADLTSMGRQIRRLLAAWERCGVEPNTNVKWVDEIFPRADVLVFSGHRFDQPDRLNVRMPESAAALVSETLKEWLRKNGTQVIYTSMSDGADLLLAEAALELGICLRLVLIKPVVDFCNECDRNKERLITVCSKADAVTILGDGTGSDDGLIYAHCNRVFTGLAQLEADSLSVRVRAIVVWDGEAGDGAGGAAECAAMWHQLGFEVDRIEPISGRLCGDVSEKIAPLTDCVDSGEGLVVRSMLFADVKGFSKLCERDIKIFVREFRKDLAQLVSERSSTCEMVNTWGDGVIMVFRDAPAAAHMALAFRDMVANKDWLGAGLKDPLGIRIGLHSGPVWAEPFDPILQKPEFCGGNINRAARIEPITEVGQVYASDGFAALARLGSDDCLTIDYVGSLPLMKRYGLQRLFRIDQLV